MIDELQGLLDVLKETPEMALWGLALFIGWKLIVYLSTTGSIVYVLCLAINKLAEHGQRPEQPKTVNWSCDSFTINNCRESFEATVIRISDDQYIHKHHVQWLDDAITEKLHRDGNASIGGKWWKKRRTQRDQPHD